ncbi:MAG: HAD-IIB family hydrolase [Candidatus Thiodiazotropha sp.]
MSKLLICTDLDRTLLPNGPQPESNGAREGFARLCQDERVRLAYVSGRDQRLVEQAMAEYALPRPDYVIADVGSTVYALDEQSRWVAMQAWFDLIAPDWAGYDHAALQQLFEEWPELDLQEPEKQNRYKLSYYASPDLDAQELRQRMHNRLRSLGVSAHLIWSIDETTATGLLDLLPAAAGKYPAIEFLRQHLGLDVDEVLFSGDSGNDLDVLVSPIPAVLVANALPEVQAEALERVAGQGTEGRFYQAMGGYLGMNGNYSAGILEGVHHYHPELTRRVLEAEAGLSG